MNMIISPQMMTSSQAAVRLPKMLSSTKVTLIASGISSAAMIREVMSRPILQICGLAKRRNANINVRVNSSFGSSPSKPRPESILFTAWNTRFPMSRAHPTASNTCIRSFIIGTWVSK